MIGTITTNPNGLTGSNGHAPAPADARRDAYLRELLAKDAAVDRPAADEAGWFSRQVWTRVFLRFVDVLVIGGGVYVGIWLARAAGLIPVSL
jgi:hypothetical protein